MRYVKYINEAKMADPYELLEYLYKNCYSYIKDYLKAFGNINDINSPMMYSGRRRDQARIDGKVRKDRSPKDTPPNIHEFLDEMFYDNFGVRSRSNALFCSGKYSTANSYGDNVYAIFPKDKYTIIWSSSVVDLFSDVIDSGDYGLFAADVDDVINEWQYYLDQSEIYDSANDLLAEEFDDANDPDDYEELDDYENEKQGFIDDNIEYRAMEIARTEMEERIQSDNDDVESLIKDYNEGDLKSAILSTSEIMLTCKEYVGIKYNYLPYIVQYMAVYRDKKPTKELYLNAMKTLNIKSFKNYDDRLATRINSELLSIMDDVSK